MNTSSPNHPDLARRFAQRIFVLRTLLLMEMARKTDPIRDTLESSMIIELLYLHGMYGVPIAQIAMKLGRPLEEVFHWAVHHERNGLVDIGQDSKGKTISLTKTGQNWRQGLIHGPLFNIVDALFREVPRERLGAANEGLDLLSVAEEAVLRDVVEGSWTLSQIAAAATVAV
ncbi:MAG: hypothetical protein KGI79_01465 [Patescibacteria group bacterium]|nr:hypothetical protein [Patescibacteria group bacterium]MDE2116526.1 hypothetical protein [Patescibacteria group bacterium]